MIFIKFFIKCVNAMKYLEKIPDVLTMYGVFTSQSTSQVRQEMSSSLSFNFNQYVCRH